MPPDMLLRYWDILDREDREGEEGREDRDVHVDGPIEIDLSDLDISDYDEQSDYDGHETNTEAQLVEMVQMASNIITDLLLENGAADDKYSD